jgi:hypothetical protein
MRRLRRAALPLALAAAQAAAGAHVVRIELRAAAETAGDRVSLADIASIHADDATVRRLAALDVGEVSPDGRPTMVDRAALARWIQARTGLMSQDIAWSGAQHCSVRLAEAAARVGQAPVAPVPAPAPAPAVPGRVMRAGVVRGNLATLRSTSGAIRLESRVEVLQDGAVGDDVRVRLPGASDGVLARVVAPGQVEVSQ